MNLFAKLTDLPEGSQYIIEDFDKRYTSTFMKYKDIPLFVYGRAGKVSFEFSKYNGTAITMNTLTEDSEHDLEVLLPEVGYYNVNGNPLFIIKNPQRQWKRSFNKNIYQICSPINDVPLAPQRSNIWFDLAAAVLKPEYAHLDHITNALFCNVALNRNLCLISQNSNKYIAYKRYPIATLNFNTRVITGTQPLLWQELLDLFRYSEVETWKLM